MSKPILFMWDGEALTPANAYQAREADLELVCGQRYRMVEYQDRSRESHNHQFAFVKSALDSLPEDCQAALWAQSPDHLRKYALIRCRFCNVESILVGSNAAALRVAAWLRAIDGFSLVTVEGGSVTRLTAQSQSVKAMGGKRFQESKQAILEFLADLIGVTPEELAKQEQAA